MKYKTIVIDPPWKQGKTGKRSVRPKQGTELDYKTMSLKEIEDFPINDFADKECHLWLWATDKYLVEAHEIMKKWGFKKHCIIVWNKNTGVCPFSFQFRNEYCLFGYRGKMNLKKIGLPTNFSARVREHSRKPDEFYTIYPVQVSHAPMIDIFSREKRIGFDQWGDEIQKFNIAPVSKEVKG